MKVIKSKEIRIGNIVIGASRGEYCTVTAGIIKAIDAGVANYHAIELTPEILLQIGFVKHGELEDYKFDNWLMVMFREYSITACNNHGYLANIKYLHQLQNLYFALDGKDLKIKRKWIQIKK